MWFDFGANLGNALDKLFVGQYYVQIDMNSTKDVILGMLDGFGTAISPSFDGCLENDTEMMNLIEESVELLEQKTASSVLKALRKLGEVAEKVPEALKECQATE